MKKHVRFLCLLLSIVMLFSLLSVSAFAAETPEEGEAEVTSAAPEEVQAEAPAAAPEEADAEEPEAEEPAPAPQEDAVPLADEEEEESQAAPELTIEGYTRVTEMPANGLATGKYLVIAEFEGKYYMLYPGATGAAATAKNSARLVVGDDGKAIGYKVGCGTAYDDAEVSTDFSAADNAIVKGEDEFTIAANQFAGGEIWSGYTVSAVGPESVQYYLFGGTVYAATKGVTLIGTATENGYFRLRNTLSNNAQLIFYKETKDKQGNVTAINYNFNQGSGYTSNTDGYTVDMMLFMSNTPYEPEPEPVPENLPEIPGYTQLTKKSDLNETVGYMIVSQDADGNLYALYPSAEGETINAGSLPMPGSENDGARTAKLTVSGDTVTATLLKGGSTLTDMNELLFTVSKDGIGYVFTAFNGRHLNLGSAMLTEGSTTLSVSSRGAETKYAFAISGGGRILDFTKTGDPNAFFSGASQSIDYWGTDFWCPTGGYKMPIYLFASTVKAPTAKSRLEALVEELSQLNNDDGSYIPMSWNPFYSVLTAAKDTLSDSSITNNNAREFLNAWNNLQSAYKALLSVNPPADATKLEVADMIPASGTTKGEPFPANAADCANFRIPAMITLQHQSDTTKNGRLVAAIDARWDHAGDACALDTIASYSDDNGANWKYNFPNYFGDSTDAKATYATAFIDPVIVEGDDGTIYLMVDLWPGGVALNTAPMKPAASTGYVEIDGEQRLVLYSSPVTGNQTDDNYAYYVGDFTGGYAPVMKRETVDGSDTYSFSGFYVDKYYYIYSTNGTFDAKTPDNDKTWCQRLGDTTYVQQNVFFYNALLHARNASYLWIVTSKDGGETWSEPQMINDQVRTGADQFYGVGPGAGLCMENGTIILPVYTWSTERAGFIYSTDKGATWHRGNNATTNHSSESCLVQIDDTTVRQFYRDANVTEFVRYTDHTWDGSKWTTSEPVLTTAEKDKTGTQLSAIKFSAKIDGKDAIILSTPGYGTRRTNGRVHVLLLNEDKTMTLFNTYAVNDNGAYYCYSSLSETADGDIALLYESAAATATFKIIPITDLAPTVIAFDYKGSYDGKAHSITVTAPSGGTFQYSIDDGKTWVDDNPAFTDVGTYAVKVKWTFGDKTEEASAAVVISKAPSSSSGGSTTTPTNPVKPPATTTPNGSTTTTVTDKATGTVTETTKYEDGSVQVVETKKDGTVTATSVDADGSKAEKVTTPEKDVTITATSANGEVLAKVEIPAEIPAPETRFADVPEGHWADEAIHNMAAMEIVNGVGGNTFNRDGGMKRGDLALLLARMSNVSVSDGAAFNDVPASAYYAEGVAWAAKTGVVTGRGEAIFAPEDTITREELAVMLHRYAKLLKLDAQASAGSLNSFTDSGSTHSWAQDGMAWCVSKGIVQGKGNGVLDPGTNVTRAEVAVMLQRFMDLMK